MHFVYVRQTLKFPQVGTAAARERAAAKPPSGAKPRAAGRGAGRARNRANERRREPEPPPRGGRAAATGTVRGAGRAPLKIVAASAKRTAQRDI